jgi:hypothetical protein
MYAAVDNFTKYVVLMTLFLRLVSHYCGYYGETNHKYSPFCKKEKVSVARELMVTLYFSFCGSLWFLWAVNNYKNATPCAKGTNINFYIVLMYAATLFLQTGCAILLLPLIMYLESKW